MANGKKRRGGVRIDMTPMVDVAFLLLIFFMCTTQFKPPEEVSVQLPESSSEMSAGRKAIIVVSVSKEGRIFIEDEKGHASEVSKELLPDAILAERSRRPDAAMIVKGDRDAEFGAVSSVMKALQATKNNRFNLMTEYKSAG